MSQHQAVWTNKTSVSTAVYAERFTLSVVRWQTRWGWAVDTVPEHDWKDDFKYLAKGTAKSRADGKTAAIEAAKKLLEEK